MNNIELKINNLPQQVKFFQFSGGERQVVIDKKFLPEVPSIAEFYAFIKSPEDIIDLMLLNDAVLRLGFKLSSKTLVMPYIPFARQDRVMNRGEALSVHVFTDLLNSLEFDKVEVDDPHSDVSAALINNVKINHQHTIVYKELAWKIKHEDLLLVSPDAGAIKKTQKLADTMSLEAPVVGFKKRDTTTGDITGTGVLGDVSGRDVLIVDDICDGGYTFIKLGESLKELGAKRVLLWVTHGIFAKGADVFSCTVDEVYSKNIWENNLTGRNTLGIFKHTIKSN